MKPKTATALDSKLGHQHLRSLLRDFHYPDNTAITDHLLARLLESVGPELVERHPELFHVLAATVGTWVRTQAAPSRGGLVTPKPDRRRRPAQNPSRLTTALSAYSREMSFTEITADGKKIFMKDMNADDLASAAKFRFKLAESNNDRGKKLQRLSEECRARGVKVGQLDQATVESILELSHSSAGGDPIELASHE